MARLVKSTLSVIFQCWPGFKFLTAAPKRTMLKFILFLHAFANVLGIEASSTCRIIGQYLVLRQAFKL